MSTDSEICAADQCERQPELSPPYCCLPCEVAATNPDVSHMGHSKTCNERAALAVESA